MRLTLHSIIFSLLLLTYSVSSQSQNAENWKSHYSYETDISKIAENSNTVYAVSDYKLFTFDKGRNEAVPVLDKSNGSKDILDIAYNHTSNSLLVVKDDLKVDIWDGTSFVNIFTYNHLTQIKYTKLNSISIYQNDAYLSTNFGIIVIDMLKKEVKSISYFNMEVYSVAFLNNNLYASTDQGLLTISTNNNISNLNNWENVYASSKYSAADNTFADSEIRDLAVINNRLYFLVPGRALYCIEDNGNISLVINGAPTKTSGIVNEKLVVYSNTRVWINKADKVFESYETSNLLNLSVPPGGSTDILWAAFTSGHLTEIKLNSATQKADKLRSNIRPIGPLSNYPFYIAYTGNKLRVTGGGYYLNNYNIPVRLSEYDGSSWFQYPVVSGKDLSSVISDPQNPDHVFACSWGDGLYEYNDKQFIRRYNKDNSELQDIFNGYGYLRCNGLTFDNNGILWVASTWVDNAIVAFERPANESDKWTSKGFSYDTYPKLEANAKAMGVDIYNNKWMGTLFKNLRLFVFNENNTLDDMSDDKTQLITRFLLEDGSVFTPSFINDFHSDSEGKMWVSTSVGLYYVDVTPDLLDKEIRFKTISLTDKNSGNLLNKPFDNMHIHGLKTDKANRKWIATDETGAFLVSADNNQILEHYTVDNSPLPSNKVLSIAVDNNTNTVYFGTRSGIVSKTFEDPGNYASPTTKIYPQIISKTSAQSVTVSELQINSNIQIVNDSGDIVFEKVVNNSQFVWDVTDNIGTKVNYGVYYIYGTTNAGKHGLIGKVSVTNLEN